MNIAWAYDPFIENKNLSKNGMKLVKKITNDKDTISCFYVASNSEVEIATATHLSEKDRFKTLPMQLMQQELKEMDSVHLSIKVIPDKSLALSSHLKIINDLINKERTDLLLVGAKGKDHLQRTVFGSFSESMLYSSLCDLLIFKQYELGLGDKKNIIYAHDFSSQGEAGLKKMVDYIKRWKAKLTIVHVPVPEVGVEVHDFQNSVQAYVFQMKEWLSRQEIDFNVSVVYDVRPVSDVLLAVAEKINADMIALTSQSSKAHGLLFGSVAQNVLRESNYPTLVLKRIA